MANMEDFIHPCNQCDFKTKYKSSLKQHVKSKHEEAYHKGICYSCDQCDFKATHKSSRSRNTDAELYNMHVMACDRGSFSNC